MSCGVGGGDLGYVLGDVLPEDAVVGEEVET